MRLIQHKTRLGMIEARRRKPVFRMTRFALAIQFGESTFTHMAFTACNHLMICLQREPGSFGVLKFRQFILGMALPALVIYRMALDAVLMGIIANTFLRSCVSIVTPAAILPLMTTHTL